MGRPRDPGEGTDADPVQAGDDRQRVLPVQFLPVRHSRRDHPRRPLLRHRLAAQALWRADAGVHRAPADSARLDFPHPADRRLLPGHLAVTGTPVRLSIEAQLDYHFPAATDVLLAVEAAQLPDQKLIE